MKSTKPFGSLVVLEDVSWQGLGNCASTPLRPNQNNFTPVLRNPVDLINATYGQLLTYVVPEVNNLFLFSITIKKKELKLFTKLTYYYLLMYFT